MPYLSQSFFKFPKYIKAVLYLKNPPLLIEILPLPSVRWTNYHIFAIKACYNCCIKITPKLRGLKPKQYFYYLLGFLWVRSLGRALLGGFGLRVCHMFSSESGRSWNSWGLAGHFCLFRSPESLSCVFSAQAGLWQLPGSYAANVTWLRPPAETAQ